MDFTIKKIDLLAAIDKCSQVTDQRHQTVAFRMMRFAIGKKGSGLVSATGEHMSVEAGVQIESFKEAGHFNVIPQRLRDIASGMPDGNIRISLKGTRITVQSVTSKRKATFENSIVDAFKIDDPGKEAPWQHLKCPELIRAIKTAKYSCDSERVVGVPTMLLIPTEAGTTVFASNSYLITLTDSTMRLEGETPIQFPLMASDVIGLMLEEDDNIRIYQAGTSRLYLENSSTLVSVALSEYQLMGVYPRFIELLHAPVNRKGPVLRLQQLADSVKSVLSAGKFAEGNEHGSRGYRLRLYFGETIKVALALAAADAEDEFDAIRSGEEMAFGVSSAFFLQLLSSMAGSEEAQAIAAQDDCLLVLRSAGIMAGIMREGPKEGEP